MTEYEKMIRAFTIFGKYEHDQGVHAEHIAELESLGWFPCSEDCFQRFT